MIKGKTLNNSVPDGSGQRRNVIMKQGIHPAYHRVNVICDSCGTEFETGSTLEDDIKVEVCSNCHPFYTGRQRFAAADGRVERFNKKFGFKSQNEEN